MANYTSDKWTAEGQKMLKQLEKMKDKPFVEAGFPSAAFEKKRKSDKTQEKLASSLGFKRKEAIALKLIEDSPLTVGEIAVINEFGSADGHVPERSFIRASFDKHHEEWWNACVKMQWAVITGQMDTDRSLGLIGELMKRDIQRTITAGGIPRVENAASTIAAKTRAGKKGDSPLIDTGQMRGSVAYAVVRPS